MERRYGGTQGTEWVSWGGGGIGRGSEQASQRQVRPDPRSSKTEWDLREENTESQDGAPAEHIRVTTRAWMRKAAEGKNGGRGEGELSKVFGHFFK